MKILLKAFGHLQRYAQDRDPLVEEANWAALTVGTHLPLWPLYIWWAAGSQAWPTSIWTVTFTPLFLVIPRLSRLNGRFGRIAMVLAGIANTLWTRWVLGPNCGTELFFVPCAVLAALLFKRTERLTMIALTTLPLAIWFPLRTFVGVGLHHYDAQGAHSIFTLNVISISVLVTAFGWLQGNVYQRMAR